MSFLSAFLTLHMQCGNKKSFLSNFSCFWNFPLSSPSLWLLSLMASEAYSFFDLRLGSLKCIWSSKHKSDHVTLPLKNPCIDSPLPKGWSPSFLACRDQPSVTWLGFFLQCLHLPIPTWLLTLLPQRRARSCFEQPCFFLPLSLYS